MANFSIPVGMKCTEKEFNSSSIGGKMLRKLLEEEGYDLSELRFTQPYIVNFYKKINDKIGTTQTPHTYIGRHVVQYWDEKFFYALCCQKEYEAITVGEFFTTASGDVFQCTGIDGDWLKVGPKLPKQPVFNRSAVHKSTYEELSDYYDLIRNRDERIDLPNVSLKPGALKLNGEPATTKPAEPIAAPELIMAPEKPSIQESIQKMRETGFAPVEAKQQDFTMTPQQLFDAMINDREVFLGLIDHTGCKCIGYKVKMISTKSVYLEAGHEHSAQPIDSFYESLEKFHLHALQKLAQSKK